MYLNTKQNLIVNEHSVTAFATEVCYSCTGSFYSYKKATTYSEPRSVERRVYFALEVTTASGNRKHPVPMKRIILPV